MTSEEPNTNSTPDLFGEGPGLGEGLGQSGGIASNSTRHDVPKEGPGNQSGGYLGCLSNREWQ